MSTTRKKWEYNLILSGISGFSYFDLLVGTQSNTVPREAPNFGYEQ